MPLTDIKIRNLKPKDKIYKAYDEKGLYIEIHPNGSKYWRFKYRYNDKETRISFGVYPEVTLAKARSKRDEARTLLADDIDPRVHKNERKLARKLASENTFELLALNWHAKNLSKWTPSHAERILTRFKKDIFPWIGNRPIAAITAQELLQSLDRIQKRGAIETAHRALQSCSMVFRYAIVSGHAIFDITANLRGALQPVKSTNHASITDPKAIGELLRAINGYQGHLVTKCALRLAPLFFVRPGELRQAEWAELNFEKKEWRIPARKMKMREQHVVPLSTQAIGILEELRPLTGDGKFVFPSIRTPTRPMSENTVLGALRRLGYTKDEMTGHGFRSMACTLLNEQGWNRDAIERQLAHAERNNVRDAYNHAEYMPERREMMQEWADYLEEISASGKILHFKAV